MPIKSSPNDDYKEVESPSGFHRRVDLFPLSESVEDVSEPFYAIASDYDGVVSDKDNDAIAKEFMPEMIKKSLAQGVPLAFITGKEESAAVEEIVKPYREAIEAMGIELSADQFMVYCNNGSVTIDVGLESQVLDRKAFSAEEKETILESETVQNLLRIFELVKECRNKAGAVIDERINFIQNLDDSTICFRIDPDNLLQSPSELPIVALLKKMTGKANPTRFDIAEKIKKEFAEMGFEASVSSTDRSIDITPKGSGKRVALEDFSRRTKVPIEDTLRIDDTPTGMGYPLVMAVGDEKRGGFSNVPISQEQLKTVQNSPEFAGTRPPVEVTYTSDQFENVRWIMRNIPVEQKGRVTGVWPIVSES